MSSASSSIETPALTWRTFDWLSISLLKGMSREALRVIFCCLVIGISPRRASREPLSRPPNPSRVFILKRDVDQPDSWIPGSEIEYEPELTDKGLVGKALRLLSAPSVDPAHSSESISVDLSGRVKFFNVDKFGFITLEGSRDDVFVAAGDLPPEFRILQEGDLVQFDTYRAPKGIAARNVRLVGNDGSGSSFNRLIDLRVKDWKFSLLNLAEPESWSYANQQSPTELPILDSYIRHTFIRLEETGGLRESANGLLMSFNTGLVTENQESIYALCDQNLGGSNRPWRFRRFCKESDREFVANFGSNLPPLAEYFENPSELLFDRRVQLFINIDHILDRIERFPKHLQDNPFVARQLLVSAQAQTEKRVYRNYKTAIPQFFRDKGKSGVLQLLLPICLITFAFPSIASRASCCGFDRATAVIP
jgi:cold shock CspA family protein